jgi:MarR family transcriptional regulator, organic hydroperoxide resistance regulator
MDWNLDDQLCFLLYSNFRKITRIYQDYLEPFDLTYTQYITLIVLFEKNQQSISDLGQRLNLDSGTLTPLLKKLEKKGYVQRVRGKHDERKVYISLTDQGNVLKKELQHVPIDIANHYELDVEEAQMLQKLLRKTI